MEDRINVNGEWYIKETTANKKIYNIDDTLYYYGAENGHFEFTVIIDLDGQIRYHTACVKYTPDIHRPDVNDYWDNTDYLIDIRDGLIKEDLFSSLPKSVNFEMSKETIEDRYNSLKTLLNDVTSKGWLKEV